MTMSGRTWRAAAGATLALLLGCGAAALPVLAADHAVGIKGFAFGPATTTVSVGDTVTWTNGDTVKHTATADDGSFDTGSIAPGATAHVTFAKAGTYAYACAIHAKMTGTIVVEAAAGGTGGAGSTPPQTDTVPAGRAAASGGGAGWPAAAILTIVGIVAQAGSFGAWRRRRPSSDGI